MKLRFKVNQKSSLRRGVNANTSIVDLDIDPATMPQEDRDLIADHLVDGIEVRQPKNHNWGLIEASGPELGDLLNALRAHVAQIAQEKADKEAAEIERKAEHAEKVRKCAENFAMRKTKTGHGHGYVEGEYVSYTYQQADFDTFYLSEVPGGREWSKELEEAEKVAKKAAEEEFKAKVKADFERLAAFLGWHDRLAKGYVTYQGLKQAATDKILAGYGVTNTEPPPKFYAQDRVDLYDHEIRELETWQAKLPAEAKLDFFTSRCDAWVLIRAKWTEQGLPIEARLTLREPEAEKEEEEQD